MQVPEVKALILVQVPVLVFALAPTLDLLGPGVCAPGLPMPLLSHPSPMFGWD